jgi:hypothetical protein
LLSSTARHIPPSTCQIVKMFSGPIRPGTRGGQGDFTWSDVSADKDREVCLALCRNSDSTHSISRACSQNYLGHSINAPTGRWQKNKDVHWYNRDQEQAEADKREEIREIKQAEEDALAVALYVSTHTNSVLNAKR